MSILGTIHEDVTTDVLGPIGSWQWMVVFVTMTFTMTSMFNQYEDMFLLEPPRYAECDVADTPGVLNSSLCTYTVNTTNEYKCNKWHIKFFWTIQINKTWLVFCDHKMKVVATTIVCRLGLVFGFIIFGLLTDSFGRKKTITINVIAELVFRLTLTFCDSESWFNLIIFLRSLFASANYYVGIILVCEIASCIWRTTLVIIVSTPRVLATICSVPVANITPNLETFNFIACVFAALLLIALRWTPESPQWLLYNRKIAQAEKVLLKAVKMNNIYVCSNFKIRPANHRAYHCLDESWNCIGIFTTHNIRTLTMAVAAFWGLYYYLWSSLYIRLYTKQERFIVLNLLFIICLLVLLHWCVVKKLKLRTLLVSNTSILAVYSISLIFMEWYDFNKIIARIVSCLAIANGVIVHGIILNITPRLFAINVRATLFGCCNAIGQLGSIICYLLIMIHDADDVTRKIIEASFAIILAIICFVIPDVDGRELPDVFEDMDYFSELSKPLRWVSQKTNSPSQEELEMRVYSFDSTAPNLSNSQCDQRLPARRIGTTRVLNLMRRIINNISRLFHKNVSIK